MFKFIADRSIGFKIGLLPVLPLILIIVTNSVALNRDYQLFKSSDFTQDVLAYTPAITDLVHELQIERGLSVGFIESNGLVFGDEIIASRAASDAVLARFLTTIPALTGSEFSQLRSHIHEVINQLPTVRDEIDGKTLRSGQAERFFTLIISDLLAMVKSVVLLVEEADTLRAFEAFLAVLEAKEHAGLERAAGSAGFAAGKFDLETYERFSRLNAIQTSYLETFRLNAHPRDIVFLDQRLTGSVTDEVEVLRQQAYSSPFGADISQVSARQWFEASTNRIEALKDVEDKMALGLFEFAAGATAELKSAFMTRLVLSIGVIALTVLISILVYMSVVPPIHRVVRAMNIDPLDDRPEGADANEGALDDVLQKDEIGQLARSLNEFKTRLRVSQQAEQVHIVRERALITEVKLLSDLNEWLQSSTSLDELFEMTSKFMQRMLPNCKGSVYVYSNSRDVLDGVCTWNDASLHAHIKPDDCWSLRRGRSYTYQSGEIKFSCEHTKPHNDETYTCLPILAHGETVGLIHLTPCEGVSEEDFLANFKLAQAAAEQISLAIANGKMRDQLRQQSIQDPLTGLFNRRHFIDMLRHQVERSSRTGEVFCLASVDVDHFKKFNDNHGHDAGDMVLRAVGSTLERMCVGQELPCRIGGEEFMVLMPGSTAEAAEAQANALRKSINEITVNYGGKTLPKISISVGIAVYPVHGNIPQELMNVADEALYASKGKGRDCVTIAGHQKSPEVVDFEAVRAEMEEL